MNGKEQTAAMARLMNTEQRAPSSEAWKPDQLAGFKVGDMVELPNINTRFRVIDLADPLLVLESPSGRRLQAGWRAVSRINTRATS